MSRLEELSSKSGDLQYLQQKWDVGGGDLCPSSQKSGCKDKKSLRFAFMKAKAGREANCLCRVFWFCLMLDVRLHRFLMALVQPHCSWTHLSSFHRRGCGWFFPHSIPSACLCQSRCFAAFVPMHSGCNCFLPVLTCADGTKML